MKRILIDASSLLNLHETGMLQYLLSLPMELFTTNLELNNLPSSLKNQLESSDIKIMQCEEELEECNNNSISFTNSYLFSDRLFLIYGIKHEMSVVSDESLILKVAKDHNLTVNSVSDIIKLIEEEKIAPKKDCEKAIKLMMILYPSITSI